MSIETRRITTKIENEPLYRKAYPNFGWRFIRSAFIPGRIDMVILFFERDAEMLNHTELTRLQRKFDAHVKVIHKLENQCHLRATMMACAVGICGALGGLLTYHLWTKDLIILSLVFGCGSAALLTLPIWVYRWRVGILKSEYSPLIYENEIILDQICAKGKRLVF